MEKEDLGVEIGEIKISSSENKWKALQEPVEMC